MSNRERLQTYALVGARVELETLLEQTTRLKQDFPRLSSLSTVQAALSSTIDELDEITRGGGPRKRKRTDEDDEVDDDDDDDDADDEPAAKPKPKPKMRSKSARTPNGRSESAPKKRTRKGGAPSGLLNGVRLVAWLKGRDVLNLLKDAPDGLTPEDIAKALKLTRQTAYWRLKVRRRKGHVKLLDEATTTFGITPAGRAALEKDEDTANIEAR